MGVLAALAASACISAPVSYAAPPDVGAPHIPWVHAGPVVGYLFYYGAPGPWKTQTDRVLVTPGGGITGQYATKILWHVKGGSLLEFKRSSQHRLVRQRIRARRVP